MSTCNWGYGPQDHGNLPLGHDRDCERPGEACKTCTAGTSITVLRSNWESRWSDEPSGPWEKSLCASTSERTGNLHDLHNRGIDHLVHVQLWKRSAEQSGPWETASAPRQGYRATVVLVRTGHDAEHHGPEEKRREYSANCIVTSKTSRVLPPLSTTKADSQGNTTRGATYPASQPLHMPLPKKDDERRTVLLVHTDQDAEHLEHADRRKEHSVKFRHWENAATHMPLPKSAMSAASSQDNRFIPAEMPVLA